MTSKTFVDRETIIDADWLNDVDRLAYGPATKTIAKTLTPVDGAKIYPQGSDGGVFVGGTGKAVGYYNDDGGDYYGTRFKPIGGDGATGWERGNWQDGIQSAWFGVFPGNADDGANFNLAASVANTLKTRLHIEGGDFNSSIHLDWSTYTVLNVSGAGNTTTVITFTADVDGITFGGLQLEGLQVKGIGALATGDGVTYTTVNRHYTERVWAQEFNNGHVYKEGNASYFNFITGVSNNNDGFVNSNVEIDHHGPVFGQMDLRANGRDGLHVISDVPNNVGQQMHGGTILCQSNGRYGALLNGRGHSLTIYAENNTTGGLVMDTNSEGCQVDLLFGDIFADNGTNNDIIQYRTGSVETVVHSNLQAKQSELNNRDYVGRLVQSVTADRAFQIELLGTSSDATLSLVHPTVGSSINFDIDGRVNSKKITNTDLAAAINVSSGNLLELTNSVATSVASLTSPSESQVLTIVFMDNNSTIVSGTVIRLAGGANFVGSTFDTLTLVYNNPDWHEISRSVNA